MIDNTAPSTTPVRTRFRGKEGSSGSRVVATSCSEVVGVTDVGREMFLPTILKVYVM